MDDHAVKVVEQRHASRLSRRAFLHGALGTSALAVLAACAPTAPPAAPAPAAQDRAQAGAGPVRGGTLQILARLSPPNLSYYGGGFGMFVLANPVYDLLLSVDVSDPQVDYRASSKYLPRLAESWEQQPDGMAYTFRLRRGVKWHDGTPFTSKDVAATFNFVQQSPTATNERGILASVASFATPDDFTFTVAMKQPDADFLENLGLVTNSLRIHPEHLLRDPDKMAQTMIGTGPFKLASNDLNKETVLVRNPDYWEPGKPYMERVTIRHKLDRSAETAAFVSKQLDIIYPPDKAVLEATRASVPNLRFAKVVQDLGPTLVMNMTRPPFDDVRVRRALQLALDRQALNQALSLGDGVINAPGVWGLKQGWTIPQDELLQMPGFRQPKDQDIAEAKKLLADAAQSGLKTTLIYPQSFSTAPKIGEVTAESFRKIGVSLELRPLEDAVWLKNQNEGAYDIVYVTNFNATPVRQWRNILHSKGSLNKAGINDAALDKLIDDQGKEVDVAKRQQMWLQVQKILLDQVYVIPTVDQANYAAWHPWVNDLRYALSANITLPAAQNVWLDVNQMPAERR